MSAAYKPWSTNPNAPPIPEALHVGEAEGIVGVTFGAICYGIVIDLFFRCLHALFLPSNRVDNRIRWGPVVYTTLMFLFCTMYNATYFYMESLAYIDRRNFPGTASTPIPGPVGYYSLLSKSSPVYITADFVFLVNTALSDALLLYRCYVIYSKNYKVIILPVMMFLTVLALGIAVNYELARPGSVAWSGNTAFDFTLGYFGVSFALNLLLTCMIVFRLYLHNKRLKGTMDGSGGLYTSVAAMVVESSAIYAVSMVLFFGPWAARSSVEYVFFAFLPNVEVIAPFLIILRVANRRAFTGEVYVARNTGSLKMSFQRPTMTDGSNTLPGEYSMNMMDSNGKVAEDMSLELGKTSEIHSDES